MKANKKIVVETTSTEQEPVKFTAYQMLKISPTERQVIELEITGDKITSVKAHEPDLSRIVLAKFMQNLFKEDV
jgi:hypothetical protein